MASDRQTKPKFSGGHISVTGNLGADPRRIQSRDGEYESSGFTIYVASRDHRGDEYKVTFDVILFGYRAEYFNKWAKKGDLVDVSGEMYFGEYDGKQKISIEAKTASLVAGRALALGRTPRDADDRVDDDDAPRIRRRREDDDEDDSPRTRRRRDEDDEDEAPRIRRRRDEEDEDDAPRIRRRREDDDEDDAPRTRRRRDDEDEAPRTSTRGDDLDD